MKASKYNFIWDMENGKKIAFNAITCALAEVDDDFMNILENVDNIKYEQLEGKKLELVNSMLEGSYIYHDPYDEFKVLKHTHLEQKFNKNVMSLTIAPTLECNFSCSYCYETPKKGIMTESIQDALCYMIEDYASSKNSLLITWYGGEPLLAKDVIYSLSEKMMDICNKSGCTYDSYMITNGYLLDEEGIKRLLDLNLRGIQITIDGPPHIHDSRRKLKGDRPETFCRIMENIKLLLNYGISPDIRINLDKKNTDRFTELVDIFKQEGLENIHLYLGQVTANTIACKSNSGSCLNTKEFSNISLDFNKMLADKGFTVPEYFYYPGVRANFCGGDQINSFVIDPEGYMYKCWNIVGDVEEAIGNVKDLSSDINDLTSAYSSRTVMNHAKWMTWSPLENETCSKCKLLPICMGGCPHVSLTESSSTKCEKWKYTLEDVLKYTYLSKITE